jgi:hypothetical protein
VSNELELKVIEGLKRMAEIESRLAAGLRLSDGPLLEWPKLRERIDRFAASNQVTQEIAAEINRLESEA